MYAYLDIAVFAIIALAVPAVMLLSSLLIRPKPGVNQIQEKPFESGEESIGGKVSAMREYMHYFSMFLVVEISSIVLLLWAISVKAVNAFASVAVLALPALALLLCLIIIAMREHG
ncbi:MAG: NADH-quinone oxidoreductase subunit A [Candidatus Micrarchaeaceae archaeon]